MHINLPLVIGLASGFALVNSLLVLTWCFCKRRKGPDHEQANLTDMNTQHSLLRRNRLRLKLDTDSLPSEKYDRYPVSSRRYSPMGQKHTPSSSPLETLALSQPLRSLLAQPTTMGIGCAASTRSDDSASIYSTVSAPRHLHDELLLSYPAPNDIPTYQIPTQGYSIMDPLANGTTPLCQLTSRHRLSVIEELAPETYDRKRRGEYPPSATSISDALQVSQPTLKQSSDLVHSHHLRSSLAMPPTVARQYRRPSYLPSPYSPPLR
ncbi:hypothetical protein GALMADRAFT_140772 [Galerina marginata CBS 339.88]|uniref:Uncharacterized protein n=1 Tax=Galerina marginata (strain CBS 339.88) TaxID=685588 RepID=A0A067SWB9_GALM3|nr:hypothetical protein GALMADRAFT_140772 [Galerina marginata CBS 339.88]